MYEVYDYEIFVRHRKWSRLPGEKKFSAGVRYGGKSPKLSEFRPLPHNLRGTLEGTKGIEEQRNASSRDFTNPGDFLMILRTEIDFGPKCQVQNRFSPGGPHSG